MRPPSFEESPRMGRPGVRRGRLSCPFAMTVMLCMTRPAGQRIGFLDTGRKTVEKPVQGSVRVRTLRAPRARCPSARGGRRS